MGGIVTGILVWGTGQWERGIRWPRRWFGTTNRGLRGFNCKLVVIKESWWREALSTLSFLFSYGLFSSSRESSYRYVDPSLFVDAEKQPRSGGHHGLPNIHEDDEQAGHEEDLAAGGDAVKLLLLPKPFSPSFRENWDIYRTDYWEKENERRAILRKKLKERDRYMAKQEGGWLWWTGWRGWKRGKGHGHDIEKTHHHHRHVTTEKDHKRTRSGSVRSGSHSRNSSRSTTPTTELDDGPAAGGLVRRGSNASSASERRRKKAAPPGGRVQKLTPAGSRSATPEVHSPLVRENSLTGVSAMDSERSANSAVADADTAKTSRIPVRPVASSARKSSAGKGSR